MKRCAARLGLPYPPLVATANPVNLTTNVNNDASSKDEDEEDPEDEVDPEDEEDPEDTGDNARFDGSGNYSPITHSNATHTLQSSLYYSAEEQLLDEDGVTSGKCIMLDDWCRGVVKDVPGGQDISRLSHTDIQTHISPFITAINTGHLIPLADDMETVDWPEEDIPWLYKIGLPQSQGWHELTTAAFEDIPRQIGSGTAKVFRVGQCREQLNDKTTHPSFKSRSLMDSIRRCLSNPHPANTFFTIGGVVPSLKMEIPRDGSLLHTKAYPCEVDITPQFTSVDLHTGKLSPSHLKYRSANVT